MITAFGSQFMKVRGEELLIHWYPCSKTFGYGKDVSRKITKISFLRKLKDKI